MSMDWHNVRIWTPNPAAFLPPLVGRHGEPTRRATLGKVRL